MIIYRDPDVAPRTLLRSFAVAFWCSLIGTVAETATILGLYATLWHRWTVTMKIMIPILHCVFTAAQLWGEYCTWCLWQKEKKKAKRLYADGAGKGEGMRGNESKVKDSTRIRSIEVASV